ncbi:hypothetical protein BpHYR1_002085 [Brachionus plicatilis]|uniref:Uncharacterized protein n=1 Tax=Brachionus plicatilis TaxID=10195 RepID=A0A3M7Q271_BRAPC|nr:hypothetical protein BpHYR1_002085 [Brachionus plicatilis]
MKHTVSDLARYKILKLLSLTKIPGQRLKERIIFFISFDNFDTVHQIPIVLKTYIQSWSKSESKLFL